MSYYLQRSADDMEPLASISGLGDLRRWVESLPPGESGNLRHLLKFGWSGDAPGLRKELGKALSEHAPKHDVAATATNLARLLEEEVAEVVSITDGMGE